MEVITQRILALLAGGKYTKRELAERLDMTRPTLDRRLVKHTWTKLELKEIKEL